MKLKEIIRISAGFLGLEKVVSVLDNNTIADEYTQSLINRLVNLTNLVTGEMSNTYLPLSFTEEVSVIKDNVSYTELQKQIVKILSVADVSGNELQYKQDRKAVYIYNASKAIITYQYVAENYELNDELDYSESEISKGVIAYGVCAEYCLTERRFEEAVMWHERFVNGLKEKICPKNGRTAIRRWE